MGISGKGVFPEKRGGGYFWRGGGTGSKKRGEEKEGVKSMRQQNPRPPAARHRGQVHDEGEKHLPRNARRKKKTEETAVVSGPQRKLVLGGELKWRKKGKKKKRVFLFTCRKIVPRLVGGGGLQS